MNIFVCIKQVPATNKVQVDEKTGVLKRSGVMSKMNPYDLYALETALRLREKHGGKVTVGTMGPPQAQAIIREAYAIRGIPVPCFTVADRIHFFLDKTLRWLIKIPQRLVRLPFKWAARRKGFADNG